MRGQLVADRLGCGHGGWQSRRDLCSVWGRTPPPAYRGHLPFQGRLYLGFRRRGHLFHTSRTLHPPIQEKPMAHAISFSCIQLSRPPTPHVRGGSVSRRGLNQPSENRTPLSGGTNSEEPSQPKRQPLFGREGSRGRGASLREAASPPRIPPFPYITLMQNSSQTLAQ